MPGNVNNLSVAFIQLDLKWIHIYCEEIIKAIRKKNLMKAHNNFYRLMRLIENKSREVRRELARIAYNKLRTMKKIPKIMRKHFAFFLLRLEELLD